MISSIDVKEYTSILEDFVKSNEHIIQRIKSKVVSSIIFLRLNIEFVNKIRNKTQESIINLPKINYLGGMESLRQNFISYSLVICNYSCSVWKK
jgi:flagellar biosynthesis regulator FlaF